MGVFYVSTFVVVLSLGAVESALGGFGLQCVRCDEHARACGVSMPPGGGWFLASRFGLMLEALARA